MYKRYLILSNLQRLICHKTQPNQTKPNRIYLIYMYTEDLTLNNLQWLIYHKIRTNQTKSYIFNVYVYRGFGSK